ncbi:MAG: SufS family cysteine desulfurase [Alphaproteobacteria bacterium]|nr:SufS family cysteine desulfurase [Alphaproteobacteria bacterium]
MSFDLAALRAQFPILHRDVRGAPLHYLDNAATSHTPLAVADAVRAHDLHHRANVHRGVHKLAEEATEAYEAARGKVARYLNVERDDVVFTSGATAALNLVAQSLTSLFAVGDEILLSELEHHSNIVPWQLAAERRGLTIKGIPATPEGRLDLDALDRLVTPRTRLIAVTHVSNVTGAVSDVARLVAAARAVGAHVLLDGSQRAPHGPVDVAALGVDFYAFTGHKMFAPNGIGVLWGRREVLASMPPFLGGGEMIRRVTLARSTFADPPRRFEAGTPPIAQAVGLGAAVDFLMALDWPAAAAHEMALTQRLLDGLGRVRGARVIGPTGLQQRASVVSFDLDGIHPHDVCQLLDSRGVALRGGHHCAQPLMDRFDLAGTTRASIALYNTEADIDALLTGLDAARETLGR